jgi:hypothetical protein
MIIGQKAFDLIVQEEVSSKAYYIKHYRHPEWPGGASGVTIAIGYDLGYASPGKIRDDWARYVTPGMLNVMLGCSGLKGTEAQHHLAQVKNLIVIEWDWAIAVFNERDVPQWAATVRKAVPNTDRISLERFGVLVSIAYNRGAGGFTMKGDRYLEMREIRERLAIPAVTGISDYIRGMKRLWPTVKGLRDRRDHEAALWDASGGNVVDIHTALPDPDPGIPTNPGPARTKPPATTSAQHTTAGAIVAAGAGAANEAAKTGSSPSTVLFIILGAVAVAAVVWILWYRNRNPK